MSESTSMAETSTHYAGPVRRLLNIGKTKLTGSSNWPDYLALYELGHDDIPSLIRMACDPVLDSAEAEDLTVWAPVHAWRALGQLRAEQAIGPLLALMDDLLDDDFADAELPMVIGMIGAAAIAPLVARLAREPLDPMSANVTLSGVTKVAEYHPACRDECIGILTGKLLPAANMTPEINGLTVGNLLDLAAVEAIDTIRDAFARDAVDPGIVGDLEDVEITLGFRTRRSTPAPNDRFGFGEFREDIDALPKVVKAGRNEQCPCGSGKKYKKCCLK
jgi:hypothetical protein